MADVTPILFTLTKGGGSVTITISCPTNGATIHYTIDGSTPTSLSATYSGALEFFENTTIKAIACKTGLLDSNVATLSIEVALPTPVLERQDGTDVDNCKVVITNMADYVEFEGVTFRYRGNGEEPTIDSPQFSADGSLKITSNVTLKVKAFSADNLASDTASITITGLEVQEPVIAGE